MTKFIYDTKSIMTRAWEIARESVKASAKFYTGTSFKISARDRLYFGLQQAWAEAKEAMAKAKSTVKAISSSRGRYVELLSVAIRDGLNHGKSWRLNSDTCSAYGFHPMHEGELICYVYAN